jgi:AraC-like DNA-binding protein
VALIGNLADEDSAKFLRPATLAGVEALHATFVKHHYAPHVHDSLTVAYVDHGTAAFELQHQRHVARADNVFVIPPHEVHTGEPVTVYGYSYRVLYIDAEAVIACIPDTSNLALSRLPTVVRHARLSSALRHLHELLAWQGHALELGEALSNVIGALVALSRDTKSEVDRCTHPAVAAARDYIHEHWQSDFSLAELAAAVSLSPFHLSRLFGEHVGMPPSAYRRALRVRSAQRLLRHGAGPAAAAALCGFYDQAHLNRHFKRVTGVTPGQYATAS